jgi:hypothetical protein
MTKGKSHCWGARLNILKTNARKARTQAKSYDKQAYDRTGYDGNESEAVA